MTVKSQQPSSGRAVLAFVAEAPGEHEVGLGKPLVGPSGRLLNAVLYKIGLNRSDCYVGNVFGEKFDRNDIATISIKSPDPGGAFPCLQRAVAPGCYVPKQLGDRELGRLQSELQKCQPGAVVALGGTAAWALVDTPKIKMKQIRGTVHDCSLGPWKVVPTWHPAYVLRSFSTRTMLEADIRKALDVANGTYRDTSIDVFVPVAPYQVAAWFRKIPASAITAVDIECQRGEIDCIGFSWDGRRAMTVPLADGRRRYWSSKDEVEIMVMLSHYLSSPSQLKIFQNGQFDVWWIWDKWRIKVRGWHHDTRIMHHAVWPDQPKDLGSMAATHLNIPSWKNRNEDSEK